MQHLPPYTIYKAGLDWSKHWTHCRTADVDELFPLSPVVPSSPNTQAKLKRVKRTDWDGVEQRKVDKIVETKK